NRPIAIKGLSKRLTENRQIVERFNQEALIIARLAHPNIIHIIDRGVVNGMYYFVMDFVKGTDFSKLIKMESFDANKNLDVIIQVCKALSFAHKNGIIHRDIKPANILINNEGDALVSDFGIAQLFDKSNDGQQLTSDGTVMGTIAYMSPEQKISSKNVTSASDIYSLGVVIYEMFTGTTPLGRFKLPSEINSSISKQLENTMLKCLETNPEDRFKLADDLKDQLLENLQGAHIEKTQKDRALHEITNLKDKFLLLDIIKEDDFGGVYLFEKKETKKLMVIKKVKSQAAGLSVAKILSKLEHNHIISIYGVSGDKDLFIIVMEYISGGSLKERLIRAHPAKEALKICRDICEALSFAHKNRIIHGNLRPSNILSTEEGEVKITDFGLEEHYSSDNNRVNWYHPPGELTSPSLDIFAVGVIFYQLFTGLNPDWQKGRLVPAGQFSQLPLKIQMIISKMTSIDPTNRYENLEMIIGKIDDALKREEAQEEKQGEKTSLPLLWIILSLLAAGIALFFFIR
ncbi:MAG: serine/threonine-protein kinase, partial [Nitrospinota bacterium]|nr:serine/threonine-protein kinase [Nitrospinota bacterium]